MSKGRINRIRIIGGEHRGRKLSFPDVAGLRPTADRVRETLFNWLQSVIPAARCLDLFAGSGALGLEALSRGAAYVLFADQSNAAISQLAKNLDELGQAGNAELRRIDALKLLERAPDQPFEVVFVDPPFAANILQQACQRLEQHGWLSDQAYIYLEQDSHQAWPSLPMNWQIHREGRAGQAAFRLMKRGKIS